MGRRPLVDQQRVQPARLLAAAIQLTEYCPIHARLIRTQGVFLGSFA
jgi:hypothetical protein